MRRTTVIKNLLQSETECYYKVRQVLQSMKGCYYKVRQVLQSVTVIHWWLLVMLMFSDFHIAVVFLLTEFSSQMSFEQSSKGALKCNVLKKLSKMYKKVNDF